jgi:hypothetical protein
LAIPCKLHNPRGNLSSDNFMHRPNQQFVELVIKRLEAMLLDEVINLRSKNLLEFFSDSMIQFDADSVTFRKAGDALKPGDVVVDDATGEKLKVKEFLYEHTLCSAGLISGQEYDIFLPNERKARTFKLELADTESDWYKFVERMDPTDERVPIVFQGSFAELPPAYRTGFGCPDPSSVTFMKSGLSREESFETVRKKTYMLMFEKAHVVVALGCVPEVQRWRNILTFLSAGSPRNQRNICRSPLWNHTPSAA